VSFYPRGTAQRFENFGKILAKIREREQGKKFPDANAPGIFMRVLWIKRHNPSFVFVLLASN